MSAITADRAGTAPRSGYCGVLEFAHTAGLKLEAFQHRIIRAVLGPQGEALILLPRGAGKTTLMALVVVHHLLTVENARVYVAASSRDQARILYEAAEAFARPLGIDHLVFRHLEIRWCPDPGEPTRFDRFFRVLPAEGPRLHGLTPTLLVWDEAQAVSREDVYPALASALHKAPGSKLVMVSTAGQGVESPLGQIRRRALALPSVKRRGAFTEAIGTDLVMLEWAVASDVDIDNARAIKQANPASWINTQALREQRKRLPELAYRRFIANQWTERQGHWLPPGAWRGDRRHPELREWSMFIVARAVERIADNTVDIAEQTAFVVTGLLREFTDASQPA